MNSPMSAKPSSEAGSQQPRVTSTTSPRVATSDASANTPGKPGKAAPRSKPAKTSSRADAPAPKVNARHAHLFVTHIDPWSVAKNAFMLTLALGIVYIVAVTIIWIMLTVSGTLDQVTSQLTDLAGGGADTLDPASLFSFSRIIGVTSVIAVLEVILLTALATLFAFLYNLAVGITGGLQVTLTDDS